MININRLKETDICEQVSIKKPSGGRFMGYYNSLDAVHRLLSNDDWEKFVTGYYINVGGDYDAVRISYFTPDKENVINLIEQFVEKNNLEIIKWSHADRPGKISEAYGGEEMRFRRFLSTYTQIGLEIMEADLLNARCLLATFRWQVMRAKMPFELHFKRTFEQQSPSYNSLSPEENEQFWKDMAHWPNPPQYGWAHFLINMVLGCDWSWESILSLQAALTYTQINEGIRDQGFQIPEDWVP
jgi:hypothetical protein